MGRDFNEIFDPQGIGRVNWQFFPRIVFPTFLAAILNFCVKRKNPVIRETVRQSDFSEIFGPPGYSPSKMAIFPKNHFPAIFGGHLEFLCKMQ